MKIANEATAQIANKNSIDWNKVERVVTLSQPPRIEDVPAMVRYVQYWGGGNKMQFIHEIKGMVSAGSIPMDRIIAGSYFDAFAKLSFPPNELPPIFITCTLLAHAACDEQYVYDNICRFITLGDIASIATKKKSMVLAAEPLLRRARAVAKMRTARRR